MTASPLPSSTHDPDATHGTGIAAAAIGVTGMAFGPIVIKFVDAPGLSLAFMSRFAGGLVLLGALLLSGRRPTKRMFRLSALGGLAFGVDAALIFSALKLTTVANATIISALQPALLLAVVGPLFGETVTGHRVLWTIVATGGVGLVVFGSTATPIWSPTGDLLAVGALFAWSGYWVASKHARRQLPTLEYQAAMMLLASAVLVPIVLLFDQPLATINRDMWWGVALLVGVSVLSQLMLNWSHASTPLSVSSLMSLAIPVISISAAAVILSEPIFGAQVVGMAFALGPVGVITYRAGRRRTEPTASVDDIPSPPPTVG